MPNVTAAARLMQDGQVVTQFTDTASPTSTTFAYLLTQKGLDLLNKGSTDMTLVVNGSSYTIPSGRSQSILSNFVSFSIKSATGTQPFEARSWNYAEDDVVSPREIESKIGRFSDSNKTIRKGYFTYIDDDTSYQDFTTRIKPVFTALGINPTLAICPGYVGMASTTPTSQTDHRFTWGEILQLKNEGYEIVNHGYTHGFSSDYAAQLTNYNNEVAAFSQNGLRDSVNYFVYPGTLDYKDKPMRDNLKKFYRCAYGINDSPNSLIPFDNYAIRRCGIIRAEVKSYIDWCARNGGYCVLFGHSSLDSGYTPELLQDVLQYAISSGMEYITVKDAVDKFSNVIELGDSAKEYFFVNKYGQTNIDPTRMIDNEPLAETEYNKPITGYKTNTVTVNKVSGVVSYSEPEFKTGGILTTYASSDDRFSYQIFTYINSNVVRIRHWDATNKVWGPFDTVNRPQIKVVNTFTDRPLTSFDLNTVTVESVGYSTAQALGLTDGGTIRTYRFAATDDAYGWQEYSRLGSVVDIRVRYWNTSTSLWRGWTTLQKLSTGSTSGRTAIAAVNLYVGYEYFDTTLGKPFWVKQVSPSVIWVDATGAEG